MSRWIVLVVTSIVFRQFGAVGIAAGLDGVENLLKPVERRAGMQCAYFRRRRDSGCAILLNETGHESRFNIRGAVERPFSGFYGRQRFNIRNPHSRFEPFFMNHAAI